MAATLADLLALLPDNTDGEISAADMRTVVTELWDQGVVPAAANAQAISDNAQAISDNAATAQASADNARLAADDYSTTTNARIDALERSSGTHTVSGIWTMNFNAGAVPNNGQVTCDTGDFATCTTMRFDNASADNNVDFRTVLSVATAVTCQPTDDPSIIGLWDVVPSSFVDMGGSYRIGVTAKGGSNGSLTGKPKAVFVFTVPAVP